MTDKRANNGGTRPGAGRKPSPHTMIRVAVSLTPKQYDWLKERPEGMGTTVRYFILQAMSIEERVGRNLPLDDMGAVYVGWPIKESASSVLGEK